MSLAPTPLHARTRPRGVHGIDVTKFGEVNAAYLAKARARY